MSKVLKRDDDRPSAFVSGGGRLRTALRSSTIVATFAAVVSLSGCGGGGDAGTGATFQIGVVVAGQPVSGMVIGPGVSQRLYIQAGQSLELDANEPVVWTLEVGGIAVTGSGTTVYYAGASITETAVSESRIAVDTYAAFPLQAPIPMTFTATSTIDSAQVATIDVLMTN